MPTHHESHHSFYNNNNNNNSPDPVFSSQSQSQLHSRQSSFHHAPPAPQPTLHVDTTARSPSHQQQERSYSRQSSFNPVQQQLPPQPPQPRTRGNSFQAIVIPQPHNRQSSYHLPSTHHQQHHSPQPSFHHNASRQSSFSSSYNVYTGAEEVDVGTQQQHQQSSPSHDYDNNNNDYPLRPPNTQYDQWDPAKIKPHSRSGSVATSRSGGSPIVERKSGYFPYSRGSTPTSLDDPNAGYYHHHQPQQQHHRHHNNKELSMDGLTLASGFQRPQSTFMYQHNPNSHISLAMSDNGWRQRQAITRGITRRVKLTKGNFVAEYRVASAVYNAIESKYTRIETPEFSHVRYTAATCDPDDFTPSNGYTLRPVLFARNTEILIAVTSYNENKSLYARTLHGVMLNIRDTCNTHRTKFWKQSELEVGVPGWQRITVALIIDGLEDMDKGVLDLLATVGVYQDGLMKREVDGKDTVAHVFEYTTQLSVDSKPQLVLPQPNDPNNLVPVQIILVVKAKNQKKINSHRWLFNAIGRQLEPECVVLIDAGTKPGRKSIYYLWEAFYNSIDLGGCCGEITAMTGHHGSKLLNPLVAAQNFEYKMSNILDKPLESSFGYVTVLPGAFSAYRFKAIQGRPLEQYFLGDHSLADRLGDKGMNGMSIFTKNMFLAEDRILCFELVAKERERWTLSYVQASKAETDVPETAAELIGQRRRWLNGSFAASVYSLVHFWRFYKSGHSVLRLFFFHIQALYNGFYLIFSWFAMANLWLSFSIIINLLPTQGVVIGGNMVVIHWINSSLEYIYLSFLALQFILALGSRPRGERRAYTFTLWVYAFLAIYLLMCSLWLAGLVFQSMSTKFASAQTISEVIDTFFQPPVGPLLAALLGTYGIYFISSFLYADPWHMFHSFFQYVCLAPSFINVLNVYAFCNLHDVSWGTKGSDKADALPSIQSNKGKDEEATVVDTTKVQEDIDASFKETVQRALKKRSSSSPAVKETLTLDDQNRTFRTRLVCLWLLCNVALCVGITNINGWIDMDHPRISRKSVKEFQFTYREKRNVYFAIILYGTAALSAIRFLGSLCFWVKCRFMSCCRRR